jgi:FkbM family methyltransferase
MTWSVRSALRTAGRAAYGVVGRTSLGRILGVRAASDLAFRLLWPRGAAIEIEGSRMYIDPAHPSATLRRTFMAYALRRTHEPATTQLFKESVRPGDVVVDLGANMGYFTMLAARLAGSEGRVYAFEPEPTNFTYLTRNIELNGYRHVTAYRKAVSDRFGSTKLFICTYDSGHHTINQFEGIAAYARGRPVTSEWVEIETVPLDEFLGEAATRVGVLKMDIEGAEALALDGMQRILSENRGLRVFTEFFPLLLTKMGSSPDAYARRLIQDFGFTVFAIGRDYSLARAGRGLIPIRSVGDLNALIHGEDDHVNLFLVRT